MIEKKEHIYEKAVLVNAINELSGYQPVAVNSDKDFARSVSEIDVFPCDTDGFTNLTQADLDANPKVAKKLAKTIAKSGNFFLLKKAE